MTNLTARDLLVEILASLGLDRDRQYPFADRIQMTLHDRGFVIMDREKLDAEDIATERELTALRADVDRLQTAALEISDTLWTIGATGGPLAGPFARLSNALAYFEPVRREDSQ